MSDITISPLCGSIGAQIDGLDLSQGLTEHAISTIRAALNKYRVIFFRNQHITPTDQVRFARYFGELTPAHPLVGGLDVDHPEVLLLDSQSYPLGVGSKTKGTSYNNAW